MRDGWMNACALRGIQALHVEKRPIPQPEEGKVLVRVRAAGICGSDVERVFTKGVYHYPTVIGHEFAGEVVDAVSQDAAWVGKRVAVFPLIPCMQCPACAEGKYAQCSSYDYYGSRRDGGFAEYLAVRTWNLLELPESVSFESAAMLEPAAVAMHALAQAGELAGRSVVIFGMGTIALIMAQIARACGCGKVILVTRNRGKERFARRMGFMDTVNSVEQDALQRIRDLTDGLGADIVVEGCGRSQTLSASLLAAAPFGTVICLGNPTEDIELSRDHYWAILRKQLRLCGTWNSSFKVSHDDWRCVLGMVESGRLNLEGLITDRYAFTEAQQAFEELYRNAGGKIRFKSMFINGEEKA